MKKLLFICALFFALIVNAQVKYDTYTSEYWPDKKEFQIEVSGKSDKIEKIWIAAYSLDTTSKEGYLVVTLKKVPDFIEFLNNAKAKYQEWKKTAEDNKVEEITKAIENPKRLFIEAAFSYGKWNFDYNVLLSSKFLLKDNKAQLIITTGELNSDSNRYIDSDGLAVVFSSVEEIQSFIDKFDIVKMNDVLSNKDKKEDLFK